MAVVGVGDRVRIWVLDAGPSASWSFRVVGTQFDTVPVPGDVRTVRELHDEPLRHLRKR
jgi:hypothetical protein